MDVVASQPLIRLRHPGTLIVLALMIALLIALHLMSDAVQNSQSLSHFFVPLLSIVLLGLGALLVLVLVNVIGLVLRYRRDTPGSRLTGRITALFALISLLPVVVVYYYSLGFLLSGIDSWFDVEVDRAMENALTLNQASMDLNQRTLLRYTELLLGRIEDRSATALSLTLGELLHQSGASELTVFAPSGQMLATANADLTELNADAPERDLLQSVRMGQNHVGIEAHADEGLIIRTLVKDPRGRPMLMQGLFPTSERIGTLSEQLENAYNRYSELSFLRKSLKFSFSLTLSLVLLFGLLTALLAAFRTARKLMQPISDLARGTRAVAAGDYTQQLPMPVHDDELAFLVGSFNDMTRRIEQARTAAENSQRAVEAQRAHLEAVLKHLSSGVVTIDAEQRLTSANPAARQILNLTGQDCSHSATPLPLDQLERTHPPLYPWIDAICTHMDAADWRAEVTLVGDEGRQILMCRGTPLPSSQGEQPSRVVVFDDVTNLVQAQRNAAWGEVARRLAHEIKNPLTPIQLSAERLRHKLLGKVDEGSTRIVERSTSTIVQQVEAMKSMVNEFSDYARAPQMQREPFVLDRLVGQVLDLYRASDVQLITELDAPQARVKGDPHRLRQVIHNLVKNATEAMENKPDRRLTVRTRILGESEHHHIELSVSDTGGGFSNEIRERLFEPYVTTKSKGTGLGLAIVKKIIEEHGGMILAENTEEGARIRARLPLWHDEHAAAPND